MLRSSLKKLLIRLNLLEHYYYLRYGLQYRIKATFTPFCTLSPPLLIAINSCFKKAQALNILENTDYMEFGIYRGFAFWYAQAIANDSKVNNMRFFGFDSFQGLPTTKGLDLGSDFSKGSFKCGRDLVEKYLNQYGVDWKRTFLIEGFFSDSLNDKTKKQYQIRNCSICVIDCDLYEAARDSLNFVGPLLSNKSFVIFDDWNCNNADSEKGERKAFAEFLENNPSIKSEPYGQFGYNCQVFFLEKITANQSRLKQPSYSAA
jgi:O-methyltransferase